MWGHSALRLARITRPRTLTMGPSLSPLPHQGRSYHMETICTRKSSHPPADIIRGWQLDSRLIGLLAGSDGVSHLWMCTLRTWRDPLLMQLTSICCLMELSAGCWEMMMMSLVMWRWRGARSVTTAFGQRVCVVCCVSVCACLWGRFNTEHVEMVYFSLSLGSLHLVRC